MKIHKAIQDLEPRILWESFSQVSQIPRPSKKEEKIAKFITETALKHDLPWKRDSAGNIVVTKPATSGMEERPIIILQSHMDMVCEKNEQEVHDFEKDPIMIKREGEWIMAEGTSLGADNGIGVAAALSIMVSRDIVHGPIEFLFTVDEETGLTGAMALQSDFLQGRILLNMDSEDDGVLFVGCAGGIITTLSRKIEWIAPPSGCQSYMITVSGLFGGHSGLDINKGLSNAIKLMVRFLFHLGIDQKIHLFLFKGGEKHNAIPREAESGIIIRQEDELLLKRMTEKYEAIYRNELRFTEKDVRVRIKRLEELPPRVFTPDFQNTLVYLLYALQHGVVSLSSEMPGQVETSTNLAAVHTREDRLEILTSQRSSVDTAVDDCAGKIKAAGLLAKMEISQRNRYPVWQPDLNSNLLKSSKTVYRELYGCDPEVRTIHAGLECGIIKDRFKGMDTLSFGPTIRSPHSPDERMNIHTVQKFWDFLLQLLKNIT